MKLLNQICLLCFVLFIVQLNAQVAGNVNYQNSTQRSYYQNLQTLGANRPIEVGIEGQNQKSLSVHALINAKADAYLAVFNLQQVGETAEETDELVAARVEGFIDLAKKAGVDPKDIYLDMISFVPVYEYEVEKKIFSKRYNEIPKGFELQKNIHVLYRDASVLDKLVTAAAKMEIYDLIKVEYFVENTEAIMEELRSRCMDFVKQQMADYKEMGMVLDTSFHVIAEGTKVAYPIERYQSYQAFNSTSIDAIKNRRSVTQVEKNVAMYYEKLPYNGYDIVINPVMLEPSVQYSMNFKVHFYLNPPTPPVKVEQQTERHFMLLTPEGELKTLMVQQEKEG
ncbi:MAG: SIMPL domain-containing protein [Phaeodactylibacter sp.]|nr:SIMPL domain-containing protein [Phaeodactylibacter sp.]